jgi:hypothetical protein
MLKPALLTEAEILNALRDCYDPELKLNLVDLGMIYAVATEPDPDSRPAWPRKDHNDAGYAGLAWPGAGT